MKRLSIILFTFFLIGTASAQLHRHDNYIWGINTGAVLPIGKFADVSKAGLDLSISGKWFMNEQIAVGMEVGYQNLGQDDEFWNGANIGKNNVTYELVPLVLTGTYFFKAWDRDFRPYASLGFGYFFYKNKVRFNSFSTEAYPFNGNPSLKYKISENKVGLMPSLGFLYNLNKQLALDISTRYTYIPNFAKFRSVNQTFTNTAEGYENKYIVENYAMGFTKISTITVSVGLFYRF
ncbi:OmpW family outer membrane protein [Ancylomarina longa]|nr:OmpW family outer membrane protein [Ancylomarina longa]